AHEPRVQRGGAARDLLHPGVLAGLTDVARPRPLHERGLEAVERGVDVRGVVAAAHQVEDGVAHVLGGHGRAGGAVVLVRRARLLEELVDLLDVVPAGPASGPRERVRHTLLSSDAGPRQPWTASWPQAPSMSLPRVSRTVVGIPAARSRVTNSASTSGSLAVQIEPGVGLSGIGLTCTQPRPRLLSSSPRRSARQPWSFMSLMSAYSMLTLRPVASK